MATDLDTFIKFQALLGFVGKQQELVADPAWVLHNQQENMVLVARLFAYLSHVTQTNPEFRVVASSPAGQEVIKQMIELTFNEIKSILDTEGF